MNDSNLEPGVRWFLTAVVVGFMLLVAYCADEPDYGALPIETYDRDIIGGR